MDRKEFRNYIKSWMKEHGFQAQKSNFYKLVDETYLAGFSLYPFSNGGGYYLEFGVVFLPDEEKWPFCGYFDESLQLFFPYEPDKEMDCATFPKGPQWNRLCKYQEMTVEQLDAVLQLNYDNYIAPRMDKEFVLSLFRNQWNKMSCKSPYAIKKICRLIGADPYEVAAYIGRDLGVNGGII